MKPSIFSSEFIPYMARGLRRYGTCPLPKAKRSYWEIQCILRGNARPVPSLPARDMKAVKQPSPVLYLFEPGHAHGWSAPANDLSEILVFHIHPQHPAWKEWDGHRVAAFPLNEMDVLRLETLFEQIFPHRMKRNAFSKMVIDAGGTLLISFMYGKLHGPALRPEPKSVISEFQYRIEDAQTYYRDHITSNPRVEEVARALGLSTSQLRRVFSKMGYPSPGKVFQTIQMDYARCLLSAERRVGEVASELGFDSVSTFSRTFKNYFRKSPQHFREILQK